MKVTTQEATDSYASKLQNKPRRLLKKPTNLESMEKFYPTNQKIEEKSERHSTIFM